MKRFTARDVALIAVTTALLIGGQVVFSMVSGVEIVTVLLLCFSYSFGKVGGMSVATAFSLLRCLVFGFYPSVLILYLIYYNAFAALFGFLGEKRDRAPLWEAVGTEGLFAVLVGIAVFYLSGAVKISPLLKGGADTLAWVLFALGVTGMAAYTVLFFFGKKYGRCKAGGRAISVTVAAAVCTVCFTLLDDVITPMFYGYSTKAAVAYFYNSFLAMLPQTVCTVVTVGTLFLPLTKIFDKAAKKAVK